MELHIAIRSPTRAWVLTTTSVILESGKQPSPDLDSELAINTVGTFPVQYVSVEYFGESTVGSDIVQVGMGATPRSPNKTLLAGSAFRVVAVWEW